MLDDADFRRRLHLSAGDRQSAALRHRGGVTPQHRPSLVHEAGEKGVRLVVGDSLLVVDAAVQGNIEAEGQKSPRESPRRLADCGLDGHRFQHAGCWIGMSNAAPLPARQARTERADKLDG